MIKAIELRNWRSFDAKRIDLDGGLNFIIGPNSSGKSSIIQALTFAFFGKAAFKKKDLKEFKKNPKSDTGVVVTFMTPSGQVLHLERVVKSAKEDAASLRDASHAEITADTAEIAKHVRHLVNDSVDYFKTCNYIGEGDIFSFIGEPQSSIMDHIDSFTKVAQYEPYKRKIDALSKASIDEMEALKKRLKGITATPAPGDVKGIDKKIADLQGQVAGLVTNIATEKVNLVKIDDVAKAFDEKAAHAKRVQELEDGKARASKAIDALIADLARLGIQIQAGANIEAHIAKEKGKKDEERRAAEAREAELKASMKAKGDERQRRAKQKDDLGTAAGKCPTCEQLLDDAHKAKLVSEIEADLARIDAEVTAMRQQAEDARAAAKKAADAAKEIEKLNSTNQKHFSAITDAATALVEARARLGDEKGFLNTQAARVKGLLTLDAQQGVLGNHAAVKSMQDATTKNIGGLEREKQRIEAAIEGLAASKQMQADDLKAKEPALVHEQFLLECLSETLERAKKAFRVTHLNTIKQRVGEYWKLFHASAPLVIDWDKNDAPQLSIGGADRGVDSLSESEKLELYFSLHLALLELASDSKLLVVDEPFHSLSEANKVALAGLLAKASRSGFVGQLICTCLDTSKGAIQAAGLAGPGTGAARIIDLTAGGP